MQNVQASLTCEGKTGADSNSYLVVPNSIGCLLGLPTDDTL